MLDTQVITVYKCSVLGSYRGAQDCTLCSLKSRSHGCGWCPKIGCVSASRCPIRCVLTNFSELLFEIANNNQFPFPVQKNAPVGLMNHPTISRFFFLIFFFIFPTRAVIKRDGEQCPGPEIFLVSPTHGPPEGGTIITVEGSNLGISIEDLRGRIKIGGQDCKVLALRNAVEASCVVPAQADPRQSNVSVILLPANRRKKMTGNGSHQRLHYRYLDFSLSDFSPTKGAASGGSLVRISGHNLHIGSRVEAFFDEVPCTVDRRHRSANTILCSTGSVGQERVAQNLTVVIDGARRTLASPFFYTADPIVHDIKPLTSFAAGGRVLTVHGEFLNSVTNAELLVYDKNEPVASKCKILKS